MVLGVQRKQKIIYAYIWGQREKDIATTEILNTGKIRENIGAFEFWFGVTGMQSM